MTPELEQRELERIFEEMITRLESRGLTAGQIRDVREIVTADIPDGQRLTALVRSVQEIQDEQRRSAAMRYADHSDQLRVRSVSGAAGIRERGAANLDGMLVSEAAAELQLLGGLARHSGEVQMNPWINERAGQVAQALGGTEITLDDVERHFDVVARQMRDSGIGGINGLDGALATARDTALGRKPGAMEWQPDGSSFDALAMMSRAQGRDITSGTAGAADSWTPLVLSTAIWRDILLASTLIQRIQNTGMTSKEEDIPLWGANIFTSISRSAGELADQNDPQIDQHTVRLTAQDLNGYQRISNNALDDSAPRLMTGFMDGMSMAAQLAIETALISADNRAAAQNVNLYNGGAAYSDAATTAGRQSRAVESLGWLGLRARVPNGSRVNANAAVGATHIRQLRSALGMAGVDPTMFIYLLGSSEYYSTLNLDEFARYDAFGALNALATGTLPTISRTPVVVSEGFPLGFNAAGRVSQTPADNTTGSILAFNPLLFMVGVRKMPRFTVQPLSGRLVGMGMEVGVHMRIAFAERDNLRAGRASISEVYNLTRS